MRLFVSGPMTGLPNYNLENFAISAAMLESSGYEACNPGAAGVIDGYTWQDYMRDGLHLLLGCDGVALLSGWEYSRGALLEIHVAQQLEMPIDTVSFWLSKDRIVF